jgi:hypothetical protein
MKLADLDVAELVHALGMERSQWIKLKQQENRELTEAEKVTVCVLAALEHALASAGSR